MSEWIKVRQDSDSGYYSVAYWDEEETATQMLRELFEESPPNELNFILFSTSGVHGSYNTIEAAEKSLDLKLDDDDRCTAVTFEIIMPRIVSIKYGNCVVHSKKDVEFLKKLRSQSQDAIKKIGMPI